MLTDPAMWARPVFSFFAPYLPAANEVFVTPVMVAVMVIVRAVVIVARRADAYAGTGADQSAGKGARKSNRPGVIHGFGGLLQQPRTCFCAINSILRCGGHCLGSECAVAIGPCWSGWLDYVPGCSNWLR
jgi:hypothetical protein